MKALNQISKLSIALLLTCLYSNQGEVFAQKSANQYNSLAKKKWSQFEYSQAIKNYKEALKLEPKNEKALQGLIDIYLYQYEIFDSAAKYIDLRIQHMGEDTTELIFFDLANCLRFQEKHEAAIEQYEFFKKRYLPKNKFAYLEEEIETSIRYANNAIKNKKIFSEYSAYRVENMDFFINSVDSEYTPVYIEEEGLLLYNARYKDFESEEVTSDNKYYENIYYFDLEESVASSYNPGIKQDHHHAVVSRKNDDNSILVFFKNKIWLGSLSEERLNKVTALPAVFDKYYFQPHGIFSGDGKTFIFSAMTKPQIEGGDLDIYISHLSNDSTWSEPSKISPNINSSEDEDAPFLSNDGKTLYFSSKGHQSSGGYDFYKSELIDGNWSKPVNLGYPMNSAGDDIYFHLNENGTSGFFSSNRAGGFGGMDIYSFTVDE
ncbi:PD40 domain-containing protein [Crocinitomix algicola]|uniref:PD40 domain-containing protein n=1 Tax=Crocinitomix algicola TaxID=1740263 RepID=UPI0008341CBA|nr:PD40 domain-containing protein [Crocinitomix algicola]